jgi:hypothetical protein
LDSEKWSIREDCANWLCSGNIHAGHSERKRLIAALQKYSEIRYVRWQKAKMATSALSLSSACYAAYRLVSAGIAESTLEIGWASIAFAAASVTWNLPSILQQLPENWRCLRVFDDEALQPLRHYLRQLTNSDRKLVTTKGEVVDRAILNSDWALLYLTDVTELYDLPRLASNGILMKRYRSELLVEMSPAPPTIAETEKTDHVHLHFNHQSIAATLSQLLDVSEVHNHFELVTRLREEVTADAARDINTTECEVPSSESSNRWPCRFENDDYEIRLLKFRSEVLPKLDKVKPHLFQKYVAAIDGARNHWLDDPNIGVDDLAVKLGPLVAKSSDEFAGLNRSQSVAWIRSLISGYGKYAFVRETFEAIQYDPEQYQDVQYRLLSE